MLGAKIAKSNSVCGVSDGGLESQRVPKGWEHECVHVHPAYSLPCMGGTSPSLRECDSDLGLASREISGRKPQ